MAGRVKETELVGSERKSDEAGENEGGVFKL